MIRYLPEKSIENPGLVSATLGLSFQIDESHFAPRARLASDGSTLMRSQEKELWALCEATMPPIEGTTFPFTREVYLGSLSQTFDHFQSDANGLLCKFIFIFYTELNDKTRFAVFFSTSESSEKIWKSNFQERYFLHGFKDI